MDAVNEPLARHAVDVADRHIRGEGTPERVWQAWGGLAALAPLALDALAPTSSRVVIVAPHPDDEVLGCGGALALMARHARDLLVIGVTDGEAGYPGSLRWTPGLLARRRRDECRMGLERLGLAGGLVSLGIPDGAIGAAQDDLAAAVADRLRPGDVVLTTWRHDGHPDHEAAGRAAVLAARTRGCACWEMPIWMWHWARPDDARVPWSRLRRLNLDEEAAERKCRAIAAHASQIEPIPSEQRDPVLPHWALARLLRTFETFIDSGSAE